jgi:hypothetical protein
MEKCGCICSLTLKYGIRRTFGISLWWRLHLKLTLRRRRNRTIRRVIGDALECVGNAGQFKCNLVGSARSLQDDDPFSVEVQSCPEQQPNHDGYNCHEYVVTCDGDASARNGYHVV